MDPDNPLGQGCSAAVQGQGQHAGPARRRRGARGDAERGRKHRREESVDSNRGRKNVEVAPRNPPWPIGYKKLEDLAKDSGVNIMKRIAENSTLLPFEELTSSPDSMKEDWMRLVVCILSKMSQVSYEPIIAETFGKICQKPFMDKLVLHIVGLYNDKDTARKNNVGDFFKQLCTLCESILKLTPDLGCDTLDNVLRTASRELDEIRPEGYEDLKKKLELLREKLKNEQESRIESMKTTNPKSVTSVTIKPPTNFRDLSHFPTVEDIVVETYAKPFLRPNKVDAKIHGLYEGIDDYLDVHFRLMREDFLRPLREGILDLRKTRAESTLKSKKRARIQNIRIYEKVSIVRFKTEDEKVGMVLAFDPEKKLSNVKWEYSKRLMIGSLLVLSSDEEFTSIVLVTVAKRDESDLHKGQVFVELCEGVVKKELLKREFLMVECQVFFGAYSHVLKALKSFDETSFPLSDYIVHGSNAQELPEYQVRALAEQKKFELLLKSDDPSFVGDGVVVDVNNLETWPSAGELGLDESQYRALCGALVNKMMLIQGPPGTGKTFIGLKIAACLLKNQELWSTPKDRRPMLVVCYTNHALDQFLTGLLSATTSIVRVGGGCKEPRLEQRCINFLRRNGIRPAGVRLLLQNIRQQRGKFNEIKGLGDRIRSCASQLKEGGGGIVSLDTLRSFGVLQGQYLAVKDRDILMWLCGFQRNDRVPDLFAKNFEENIVDPKDPAFSHIKLPAATISKVTMSFSFPVFEQVLADHEAKEVPPDQNLKDRLDAVKRNLAACDYAPFPGHELEATPADIWRLTMNERWQLYRHWRDTLVVILEADFEPVLGELDSALADVANVLASWRMVEDQHIMAEHLIIGMTTSYAASHQQVLKELKPRIVIVEEAAEVFEAHVLVSVVGAEHLIMIGDHKQLRPSPSVHELGVKYHLDVSMFERLIQNGVNYVTLSTQHRMRPEVAKLIAPCIYPDLKNHPSVEDFPAVQGMAKNVFFVDHKHSEEVVADAQSYQNSYEANFLSSLVKYLLLQGYDPSRITVLSTYKGQQYFFSKVKQHQSHLKDVRTTVVDNYQGEECDIILLSLVRSNAEDVVGFLKTENRVCVALSRARHGLYIIGNMANMTAADTVWRKVQEELRRQDAIGPALPLRCDRHGVITPVSKAQDFASCPQGGCLQLCKTLMPCGHDCKQVCHTQDMEHKAVRCMEKCTKPACPMQHPCPKLCYVKCPPCLVPKVEQLPCSHSAKMPCHMEPSEYKCRAGVTCTLPACGHERNAECHQLVRLDILPCKTPCTLRMPCGHACQSTCHVNKDPEHHEVKCMQACGAKRLGCTADPGHQCRLVCHQRCEQCTTPVQKTLVCGHVHKMACNANVAEFKCPLKCERLLDCGHACSKKCHEPCDPCEVKVVKTVPDCGHSQTMSCGLPADRFRGCKGPCQRELQCGHTCGLKCGQDCSTGNCRALVPYEGNPACGHAIMVPCHLKNSFTASSSGLLALCKHPCPTLLKPCDHQCAGSCGACLQGRLHLPCKSKCERQLLCGHVCKEDCPKSCPPCRRPCEQKCGHTSCNHRCGEPCATCKEPCRRRCDHGQCTKRCGDLCSFVCPETCHKKLECSHPCIGLCGDPCICRECNLEEVTTTFFGTEDEDGARFVMLPDCGHILESSGLDKWMSLQNSDDAKPMEIITKVCPNCSTPVRSCQRYANVIKRVAEDIAAVKAQFYDAEEIQANLNTSDEILRNLIRFTADRASDFQAVRKLALEARRFLEGAMKGMLKGSQSGARRVPPLSTGEAKNLEQRVQILNGLRQIVEEGLQPAALSANGRKELKEAVELVCGSLSQRTLTRLSEQEASDTNMEMERLRRLLQLLQVEAELSGNDIKPFLGTDLEKYEDICKILRGLSPYSMDLDREVEEKMQQLIKPSSCAGISRVQLRSIVAATGLGAGHWYRCPRGHTYAIGNCGQARQKATCPVEGCRASIGGDSYQLSSGNTRAADIEGGI